MGRRTSNLLTYESSVVGRDNRFPMSKRALAVSIVKLLREKGHEAYFVGGCVRDRVLGKHPSDFDIVSDARPEDLKRYFPHTIPVGEAFGVMIVRSGGESFEVSTFRTESGYRDGRRPSHVAFSDAKKDARRRDFTVNGLYYDPLKRQTLDWVEGRADIRAKVIRTIGSPSRRFREDKLRMIRAVRFAVNLGFRIEPETLAAIRRMRAAITVVSAERLRDELVKIFTGPFPGRGLRWLDRSGLLEVVLPEIEALKGVRQPREFHPEGDVYRHTKIMMDSLSRPPVVLAFGCLLHDIGKPRTFRREKDRIRFNGHDRVGAAMAGRLLERLKFPNDLRKRIVACVEGHMRFKDVRMMRESTLRRMLQRETFETELAQHRIDCLASHGDLSIWRFLTRKIKALPKDQIKPQPFLKGRDLLEIGFKPGPEIGRILREAEDKQLEGDFASKDQAVEWARRLRK